MACFRAYCISTRLQSLVSSYHLTDRIDANFVIKVADFGLSEDIYARNYFRQQTEEENDIKLPIRWMALESLQDGKFSEKTDVVGSIVSFHHCHYILTHAGTVNAMSLDAGEKK